MTIRPISSNLSGIQRQGTAMERAAEKIGRATLQPERSTASRPDIREAGESRLDQGMVEAMVARRMFTAAVRMAHSANEGIVEALRAGGYGAA